MTAGDDLRKRARALADDVLWPAADRIDADGAFPPGHFEPLAEAGLYGIAAPPEAGGPDALDLAGFARLVEVVASGCLATAFVWLQHHGAVRAAAASERPGIRETWLEPLAAGRRRAGLALVGQLPGEPRLRAEAVPGGYRLTGASPFVTGWGLVDTLYVAARDADDRIVWMLLDATPSDELSAQPLPLSAVDAASTVQLRFDGLYVPEERVTGTLPYAEWPARDAEGLRTNGSLALGLAGRCGTLLDENKDGPDAELDASRHALDSADPASMPAARADAAALALRRAAAVVVARGAASVLRGQPGQRLLREAGFLQVFATRTAIKDKLLARWR
ncbi:acyl-CoA dehydrogenase family protein [Streptomyces boninensis]|uniref:acyl-CoA dehydrogenase family protein n=1 Tax=Streptomyces boninensis TaxID=2039455 RepID=UPI003B2203E0